MKRHFSLILIISINLLVAQNKKIDSLFNIISSNPDSTRHVDAYYELSKKYNKLNQFEKSIHYGNKGIDLATKIHDTISCIKFYLELENSYDVIGNRSAGIKCLYTGLKLCEQIKDPVLIERVYYSLGTLFWRENDQKKAFEYYDKGLKICVDKKYDQEIPGYYNNLGLCYRAQKNYSEAIVSYRKCVELSEEYGQHEVSMQAYNNLAYVYQLKDSINKAIDFYFKSLEIANRTKDDLQKGIVLGNIGEIYQKIGKYKEAEKYMSESIEIAKKIHDSEGEAINYFGLSSLYETTNDPKKALLYFKKYTVLSGDVEKQNKAKDIQREEIKHQYDTELINIEKAEVLKDEKIKADKEKSAFVTYTISIGFILVCIFLILLYNRFNVIKTQNIIIESQKKLVEEKQKEVLDSIHYAKRIQATLLAHKDFIDENISNNFILFKPKDIVSGDFYWATKKNDRFYLAVCDSTGHGVPGAFMSLLNINFLNEAITEKNIIEPNKILDYVRTRLVQSVSKDGQQDGFDGILLCINQKTNKLSYAAANNTPIIISNNEVIQLGADKMPVGIGIKDTSFQLFEMEVKPNEAIYFYTDGYADQFGGTNGKKFMYKKLNDLLISISSESLNAQKEILDAKFEEWKGNLEQVDDVLIIGIKV